MPEKQEYMTLAEVAEFVGVKRASLYYYLNSLGIKPHQFQFKRASYITKAEAQRIKDIKEGFKERKKKREVA